MYNNFEVTNIMDSYIIIVFIFGILTLGILCLLFFINRLTLFQRKVNNSYQPIFDYFKQRSNLMREMINFIKKNLEHENSYIKKLETAIEVIEKSQNTDGELKKIKKTQEQAFHFLELEKTYSFLTKNEEYLKLKEQVELNEERLVYATENYDKGVQNYNDYKEKKIVSFLGKFLRFPNYDYYNR